MDSERMPSVRVMMPISGAPRRFGESVESVLAQDCPSLELVILDGGDAPSIRAAARKYERADGRVQYVPLPQAAEADLWRAAWFYAKGWTDYVTWVMEDAVCLPGRIRKLVRYGEAYPDIRLFLSHGRLHDGNGPLEERLQPCPLLRLAPGKESAILSGRLLGRGILQGGQGIFGGLTAFFLRTADLNGFPVEEWEERRCRLPRDMELALAACTAGDVLYMAEPSFACTLPGPRRWSSEPLSHWRELQEWEENALAWVDAIVAHGRKGHLLHSPEERRNAAAGWLRQFEDEGEPADASTDRIEARELLRAGAWMRQAALGQGQGELPARKGGRQYFEANAAELGLSREALERLRARWSRPWVLVKRRAAMGDVLCAEPILRKFHEMGYCVFVATSMRQVLSFSEGVDCILPWDFVPGFVLRNSLFIDLDDVLEQNRHKHVLDAYVDRVRERVPAFALRGEERLPRYGRALARRPSGEVKRICVNCEAGWNTRIYPRERLGVFLELLKACGCQIYEIGSRAESYLGVGENCFGRSLHDTVALMSEMDCFIGMDSGLMHLAQAIRLPAFLFFGPTVPNFIVHDWSTARTMWKGPDALPCVGCSHRRRNRVVDTCERGDLACMDWMPEEALEAFFSLPYGVPPSLPEDFVFYRE